MARSTANLKYINGDWATGLTAAGTTQGTATTATADHIEVTTVTSSDYGVILKAGSAGQDRSVINADATEVLYVYPWSGAAFNGQTADAPLALPAGRAAWFKILSPTKIVAIY